MILPKDPKQRPELWQALRHQLLSQEVVLAVGNGRENPQAVGKKLAPDDVEILIARMQAASVCRISENRGAAIGPHFSGVQDDRRIIITDFIATSSKHVPGIDIGQLQAEIETVALNLLYGQNALDVVLVPVQIRQWNSEDLNIQLGVEGVMLRKAI